MCACVCRYLWTWGADPGLLGTFFYFFLFFPFSSFPFSNTNRAQISLIGSRSRSCLKSANLGVMNMGLSRFTMAIEPSRRASHNLTSARARQGLHKARVGLRLITIL